MEAAERRNMTVTCSGSYVVNADSEAMKCILENLVTNAIRYGSGLGLFLVKNILDGCGLSGEIAADDGKFIVRISG